MNYPHTFTETLTLRLDRDGDTVLPAGVSRLLKKHNGAAHFFGETMMREVIFMFREIDNLNAFRNDLAKIMK